MLLEVRLRFLADDLDWVAWMSWLAMADTVVGAGWVGKGGCLDRLMMPCTQQCEVASNEEGRQCV